LAYRVARPRRINYQRWVRVRAINGRLREGGREDGERERESPGTKLAAVATARASAFGPGPVDRVHRLRDESIGRPAATC
jgi:hypothetical protein